MDWHKKSETKEFEYYVCSNNKNHCRATRKVSKSDGIINETGHSRHCQRKCQNKQKHKQIESDTMSQSTHALSLDLQGNTTVFFEKESENLVVDNEKVFLRKNKRPRKNILKTIPSNINCCSRNHKRFNFRKHMDHCARLPDCLKIDCANCGGNKAIFCEFSFEEIDYFVPHHKCHYIKKKRSIEACIRKYESKRRQADRYGIPKKYFNASQKFEFKILISSYLTELSLFSLYETAEILSTENLIRKSRMMKHKIRINLALGNINDLMKIDFYLAEKALQVNGKKSSPISQQTYFYSCYYFRKFLRGNINHLIKKFSGDNEAPSNKQKYHLEYKELPENSKHVWEVYCSYLLSTNQNKNYEFMILLWDKLLDIQLEKKKTIF